MESAAVMAILSWWLVWLGIGVAGLPIAATVFRGLPDVGIGFAIPTGIVVLALPIYWLGHVVYSTAIIAIGVVILGGLATMTWRRRPTIEWRRAHEAAIVFTLGFGLVVAIRAVDPSILPAGGEKFLDFGLLNAILRTDRLPPEDIWFAGEPVQYYYGGHLIAGVLTELTLTPAKYAYNLALAGFYGTLVSAAYGLAGSLAASRGARFTTAGGLGALFVGVASNLVPIVQVVGMVLPNGIRTTVGGWIASRTALEAGQAFTLDSLTYWRASRVIRGTINEFPLFAWLNGDLHAHMMSTPFLLLGAGVAFGYYLADDAVVNRRRALVFGVLPPIAGLVAVINTWSFPSVIGLMWLAMIFAAADPADLLPIAIGHPVGEATWRREVRRIGIATLVAGGVTALSIVWVLPFFVGPATGASGRAIGVFPDRSGLLEFVLVYGWMLGIFAVFLWRTGRGRSSDHRVQTILLIGIVVVLGVVSDAAAIGVVLPLGVVAWLLLRQEADVVGFETVLIVAGAGLVLLVEFVFVQEQAGPGRMNTVFKTYMQIWVIWGTVAGAALVHLLPTDGAPPAFRRAGRIAVVILILSVSIYGVLTLGIHFDAASAVTLDATTWASSTHSAEWEAIQWLDGRPGQPNIVTAPGCWCNDVESTRPYRWANAPSSFTGIPTLAGWSHEVGYRGREAYDRRVDDVRRIYTGTPAEQRRLLAEYQVEYVYVGSNERALYGNVTISDREGLAVVFDNGAVTIYGVSD